MYIFIYPFFILSSFCGLFIDIPAFTWLRSFTLQTGPLCSLRTCFLVDFVAFWLCSRKTADSIINLVSLVLICATWRLLCVCIIYQIHCNIIYIFQYLQLHIRFSSSKEHCIPSEDVFGGTYVSKTGRAGKTALLWNTPRERYMNRLKI